MLIKKKRGFGFLDSRILVGSPVLLKKRAFNFKMVNKFFEVRFFHVETLKVGELFNSKTVYKNVTESMQPTFH
jgi:hypothetical protein